MNKPSNSFILCIDDDHDFLKLLQRILTIGGYETVAADNGVGGLAVARQRKPDLILLDVMMPQIDGYEICSKLQEDPATAYIPVIFVTALGDEKDRVKAFSVGAVGYLEKPLNQELLIEQVQLHLETKNRWKELKEDSLSWDAKLQPAKLSQFKEYLASRLDLSQDTRDRLNRLSLSRIYDIGIDLGMDSGELARAMAGFLQLPYLAKVGHEDVQLGVLPASYAKANHVVAINDARSGRAFVLSNPFDMGLLDILKKCFALEASSRLFLSEPENIERLFQQPDTQPVTMKPASKVQRKAIIAETKTAIKKTESETMEEEHLITSIADNIMKSAVSERATDIHIEPKQSNTVIRFRIDGDMFDVFTLKKDTAAMLISRYKALSGLDITEKRKPQDGAAEVQVGGRTFKLRLATTSTPSGESLIMRLLDPEVKPKGLKELGMTEQQVNLMVDFSKRNHGLVLIVGPTGSGKTTTVYSFLSRIDCKKRSLISVEDPVEYRIPDANQQQVNEKAGVTFEALLKSSVRQDPDILYIGEVRDPYSTKVALDFASTGHLTISTMHTSNATTAIFRLERLGIGRGTMADSLLGIVALRLIKKLCPHCKDVKPITPEEQELLRPFADAIPLHVAHRVGCAECGQTGYHGREAIYEILRFDSGVCEMVRGGVPITEIRKFVHDRGDFLISQHAIEKVRELIFSMEDIHATLLEEARLHIKKPAPEILVTVVSEERKQDMRSILLVEDDEDTRKLIARYLEKDGYAVTTAGDGVDALLQLGQNTFDLILSDINMPNLDGFKLLELINMKGIDTPVVLLTGRTASEDEVKGLALGAMDYMKKPIEKEVLLVRTRNIMNKRLKRIK